jgi:tRNA A37 threonylcarbamoyladenosine dehydratase
MGAANKTDPTRVKVGDLADTRSCRLARIVRRELRRRGIHDGIRVVYSTEEFRTLTGGRPEPADEGGYQACRAPLGSSSVVPPIFGLTMAGEVLRELVRSC